MSEIKVINFSDWEEFKTNFAKILFGDGPFQRGRYIFRGQSNADWTLSPSSTRRISYPDNSSWSLSIGTDMTSEFIKELRKLNTPEEILKNDQLVLALAQHYGMPTRLLDWTESPYIAAFFAFNSNFLETDNECVAIWALDTINPIWQVAVGVEVLSPQSYGNMRLRNQTGRFTLSRTPFDSLEEYVEYFKDEGTPLIKYVIPTNNSKHVLADLDAMGINHSSLFPDIEGAVQSAIFQMVLRHGIKVR